MITVEFRDKKTGQLTDINLYECESQMIMDRVFDALKYEGRTVILYSGSYDNERKRYYDHDAWLKEKGNEHELGTEV